MNKLTQPKRDFHLICYYSFHGQYSATYYVILGLINESKGINSEFLIPSVQSEWEITDIDEFYSKYYTMNASAWW